MLHSNVTCHTAIRAANVCAAIVLLGGIGGCATESARVPLLEIPRKLHANEELIVIDARPKVTVRVLLGKPYAAPKGIVLHYPGGEGFLVRPAGASGGAVYGAFPPLVARGYVVAVVDVPSNLSGGLGGQGQNVEWFRISKEHTQDARAIVDRLHARWPVPVYVMGHSMGAISATHLAGTLDDKRLAGAILMGSPSERGFRASFVSVPNAVPHRVRVPVLIVHHRDDGCSGSTFATASRYPTMFTASPRVGFIEVVGGIDASPDPCSGDNYHSFFGVRREVMEAVDLWIGGENIRRVGN